MPLVHVRFHQSSPNVLVSGVSENREEVRILGGDDDLAVGLRRVSLDEVFRKPLQLLRTVQPDGSNVLGDVAFEFLTYGNDLVLEFLDLRPCRLIAIYPSTSKVSKDFEDGVAGLIILTLDI